MFFICLSFIPVVFFIDLIYFYVVIRTRYNLKSAGHLIN